MKLCCCLLFCILGVCAAEDAVFFRYQVDAPVITGETGVFRLAPSAEQLLNLGGVPERIRIYDRRGKIVPYMSQPVFWEQSRPALSEVETVIDEVRNNRQGNLEIRFHLRNEGQLLHEIEIQTSARDFEQEVSLQGREKEGDRWVPLLDKGFIFDSSRNLQAKNTILKLPENCRFSHFLLVVSQATLERRRALYNIRHFGGRADEVRFEEKVAVSRRPFKIDRILFRTRTSRKVVREPSLMNAAVRQSRMSWDRKKRVTKVELQADFQPAAGLRIHCSDRNFSRMATLTSGNGQLVRKQIVSWNFAGSRKSDLDLMLADSRRQASPFVLTIEHGDNPPLENLSLEWLVQEQEYVFLAEKSCFPLTVTVSGENGAPRYDQESVIREAMGRMQAVTLEFGPGTGNPCSLAGTGTQEKRENEYGWLLWTALLAAVAVMAFGIVSAGRKAGAISDEK